MCVCVCVSVWRRAAKLPLLIFSLIYICMLRGSLREERQKKSGAQEHAGCCVCISLWEGTSHDLKSKVHECITTELCVFFARQSSKNQLACTPLAYLKNRNPNVCVCLCVCLWLCVWSRAAKFHLLICSLSKFVCSGEYWEKKDRNKRELRSMLDAVCISLGEGKQKYLTLKSAWVHQHRAVCFVCKLEQWDPACLLHSCSFEV